MATKGNVLEKLKERGFIGEKPQYPERPLEPTNVEGGRPPYGTGLTGARKPEWIKTALNVAEQIASITVQQDIKNAINIGGVSVNVTPAMSAEAFKQLIGEELEKVLREKKPFIQKLVNSNLEDYKSGNK